MNICMVTSRGDMVTYISSVVTQNLEHFLLKFMVLRYRTQYLWASDPLQVLILLNANWSCTFLNSILKSIISLFFSFYLHLFLALFLTYFLILTYLLFLFSFQCKCYLAYFFCYFRRLYFYWALYLNALLVVYYLYLFLTYLLFHMQILFCKFFVTCVDYISVVIICRNCGFL